MAPRTKQSEQLAFRRVDYSRPSALFAMFRFHSSSHRLAIVVIHNDEDFNPYVFRMFSYCGREYKGNMHGYRIFSLCAGSLFEQRRRGLKKHVLDNMPWIGAVYMFIYYSTLSALKIFITWGIVSFSGDLDGPGLCILAPNDCFR